MMGGAVSGSGGPALGRHNSAPQESGDARPGSSRGLMSEGIAEQVRELTEEARASGHKSPLRHAWASPPPGAEWGDKEWDAYWTLYENAQGLEGCAFSEAIHDKPGPDGRPPHRHRVYLGITERGTLVRDGWSYAKQEAVSRITEVDTGQALTKGKHNKHAARIVADLGRPDVAAAMEAAGLMLGPPGIAGLSPAQRAQQERTGVAKADVARDVAAAWRASDGGTAFMAALRERGLRLAAGTKKDGVPVVLDGSGSTHGLRQMLGMAAREAGQPAPRQTAIAAFLGGAALPSLAEAKVDQHAAMAAPAEPAMPEAAPIPHDHAAAPAPDAGAAAPVPGQLPAIPVPEAPAPGVAAPAKAPSSTPSTGSRDGMQAASGGMAKLPGGGGGGAGSTPAADAGGGAGASLEDVGDAPGPLKPNATPDERAKHLAAWAAYEERKATAWKRWISAWEASARKAAPTVSGAGGGQGHGDVQQQAAAYGRAIEEALARLREQWERARTVADLRAAVERFEAEADHIRDGIDAGPGPEHGDDRGPGSPGSAGSVDPAGDARAGWPGGGIPGRHGDPEGGRGAEPDRGAAAGPDGGGGEPTPDRGQGRQAVRCAATQVRLGRGLAAAPEAMAVLRRARLELDPAWRERRDAHGRLRADRARIAATLATHPHADPIDRDPQARADRYAGRLSEGYRERREAMEAAQGEALAAMEGRSVGTRLLASIGISTPGQRRAEEAVTRALALTDEEERLRPTPATYKSERADGAAHAYAAQADTARWEQRPDVAQAMEQQRLNQAVDQAAQAGDPAVTRALRQGDPDAARRVIQEREEAERRRMEEQERRMGMQRGPGGPAAPAAGGPRPPGMK